MKRFILFLTMAVFTLIAISSCTCMRDVRPEPQDKYVTIITRYLPDHSRRPEIVPPVVHLEYGTGQQVIWEIDRPGLEFTISFNKNGSPFDEDHFNNANNKSGKAKKVKFEPDSDVKFYYYSVKVHGFELIDPVIIIHR